MKDVRGFIFDMDGLMLDTERISLEAWHYAFDGSEFTVDDSIFHSMVGRRIEEAEQVLKDHLPREAPVERFYQVACDYYKTWMIENTVPLKTGICELLDFLVETDFPRVVATSTQTELARQKLASAGIDHYFEQIVGGDQVTNGKPAPDVFLKAAEMLGLKPDKCIVLEDSGPGINGACTAGMRAVLIPDLREPTKSALEQAHHSFKCLHTFLDEFKKHSFRVV